MVLRESPLDFGALQLAGAAAFQQERMEEAARLLGRAARVRPKSGWTLMCLGHTQAALGRYAEAEENLKAGLALDSGNPEVWYMLGVFLVSIGKSADAMGCYSQAVKLKPDYADAVAAIADLLKAQGLSKQAIASCSLALKIDPGNAPARLCLVHALQQSNRIPEALAECNTLLAAKPGYIRAHSNRLFLLNYIEGIPREMLFAEHRAFGRLLPAAAERHFANGRDPRRRIRVGFLSPDLRNHSVAYFIEPLLAHLDPEQFEVVLYHDHTRIDAVSDRLRSHATLWRHLAGRPDAVAETEIRADAPDVMVDLAGHTGQNRLALFARRLAPVQIAYLGYPNTTGVAAMDYRFTDAIADPQGLADAIHTERLVRFSPCAWAYLPSAEVLAAGEPPAICESAALSFGSFNSLCKVNDFTLRLWARVLAAVPGSRLVLKSLGSEPERIRPRIAAAGIESWRVTLLQPEPDLTSHLAAYRSVDIALDPFPYGGTTTTCEALWMGRPVITLEGDRHASRVGASLLAAVGRAQWVARNPEEYVEIAARLAADRAALRNGSAGIRSAMRGSLLLDHRGQARRFGAALRACWANWCEACDGHKDSAPGADPEPGRAAELVQASMTP